jgi:hypothetical protein
MVGGGDADRERERQRKRESHRDLDATERKTEWIFFLIWSERRVSSLALHMRTTFFKKETKDFTRTKRVPTLDFFPHIFLKKKGGRERGVGGRGAAGVACEVMLPFNR